jgi:acyl-CoA synthetase (AMP-forming)/AMP-acid ligase II
MTLEDYLAQDAVLYPHKIAVVCGGEHVTYEQLWQRVVDRVAELQQIAKSQKPKAKSQIICLRATPTIDYLVDYFAIHRAGCVVAPLEKDMPEATFKEVERQLCQHTVPEGSADILYTTGTTGQSKGVIISHRTIVADAENLIAGQGFSHDTVFVINGPLNHIGSLSKIWPVILQGATMIIVDGMKDLDAFFAAFQLSIVNCQLSIINSHCNATLSKSESSIFNVQSSIKYATFLVPASIRILIQFSADRLAALADRIEFIETGAAAISQADMEALCRLLPNSRLYNTYASTETGIISTYNYNDGRCMAGCLGHCMPHSELFITPEGLIACKGDTLMTGYVGDPERTASILRDGILYTADIGIIDDEGMLHLKGREDDVINVGGFKVAPTEVENAAMSFPNIKDCICIAVDHPITGKALKLLVAMTDGTTLHKRTLALHLKERLESYKIPLLYEQVDTIRRTFNGKLDRKYYK